MQSPIPSKDLLEELYLHRKLSTIQIEEVLTINHQKIRFWLRRYGIKLRSNRQATLLAIQNGRICSRKGVPRGPMSDETKQKIKEASLRRGEKHAKGKYCKQGYIYFTRGENANRSEHVVIAERMLGRKLRMDEVVHHINGDKTDNRIENLQVMTRSEHMRKHRKENQDAYQKRNKSVAEYKYRRGEESPVSKLKIEDVLYIRNSKESTQMLAIKFNVSRSAIQKIRSQKTWKSIPTQL